MIISSMTKSKSKEARCLNNYSHKFPAIFEQMSWKVKIAMLVAHDLGAAPIMLFSTSREKPLKF